MAKITDNNIEFPEQKILPINMEREVRKSFIEYSMSVIVSRALPDARDGMKPGQRRILYAMYEDNLTYDKAFRKSATTVGNVLGRYHPHGDTAVYLTMARMAQPFSYRYTLVEGHGNFGSDDGDAPAAYRYTEARLSRLSNEMLRDIEKNVVPWTMNFDNRLREPTVLPCRFPNLLVNGAIGIAVGMATNIPPHNLREVIDGTIYLMDHPNAGVSELMQFIKGPDFPSGAIIYGTAGIYEAYSTGRGRIMVRARAEVEEEHNRIVVTELPYMVQRSEVIKNMIELHRNKKIDGITDIRDETGRDGTRLVIEYRRDANGQIILNQLYKYTELESTCSAIMLALVNGEPKVLGLRQILNVYISHQEQVITNRVRFDLEKALREAHINEGYKIAIDNIDEVISIIRASADQPTARDNLRERFNLTEEQAQAIVAMTLGRLSGLERQKVEQRLVELYAAIDEYRAILADEGRIKQIIRDEMTEIRDRFGDDRRTAIETVQNEIMLEDLIERHNAVITLTHAGYIKRQPSDAYSAQKRGGRGIIGMATKEEDYIERVVVADSHSYLMLFTDTGRVIPIKAYRIPEAGRTSKGSNIVNFLDIAENEKITAMLSVPDLESEVDSDDGYLVMVTEKGTVKRTKISEFRMHRTGGKIAITLEDGDRLIFAAYTHGSSDVMIASRGGYAVRFDENQVRCMGRTASGVRGMSLRDGDIVAGAAIVERDEEWLAENRLLTITDGGFGKKVNISEFEAKNRGIMGVIAQKITEKTGELCGIAVVREDEDILIITNDGTIIRTPASGIPEYGRPAAGVIVMKLSDGAKIVNFALAEREPDEPDEPEAEPEADAGTEADTDTSDAPDTAEDATIADAEAEADTDETDEL